MPAIGKDLSKIRSHLGLSIQDIQHHTKIPVSTLQSIENGTIFNHPEENQTYIRSFVRSYGRALKIDDDIMINALDQHETGNYNHLLLKEFPDLNPERREPQGFQDNQSHDPHNAQHSDIEPSEGADTPEHHEHPSAEKKEESVEPSPQQEQKPETPKKPPAKEQKGPDKTGAGPSVQSVDWANVGRKFSEEQKHTPVWIVGLIIILIIAAVVGYFLYDNGFFDLSELTPQDQEQVTADDQTAQSNVSLDLEDSLSETNTNTQPPPPAEEPTVQLDEVLELTVYAAYDGLGPVRVWSDIKPRMDPYWLEQGTAMQFEFQDTVRVRGSYSDLLLFKDGNLIENAAQQFLQQEENYLQLTRDFFLTDEKWATAVDYELPEGVPPPDSLISRPAF